MISYRDRAFCGFYKECADGSTCERALTEKVIQEADKWWGSEGAPISVYLKEPPCFVQTK